MLYTIARSIVRVFLTVFYRYKVIGNERIPVTGPVLVCCNHIHLFDPLMLGCGMERKVHFMAKAELFRIPILSTLITAFGTFPVHRGGGDRQALKRAIELLREGKVVGMFPEGTRSKDGKLLPGRIGAALIALRAESYIVPTAVIGPYRLFRPTRIVYGDPIDTTPYSKAEMGGEGHEALIQHVMQKIQELLDQHQR